MVSRRAFKARGTIPKWALFYGRSVYSVAAAFVSGSATRPTVVVDLLFAVPSAIRDDIRFNESPLHCIRWLWNWTVATGTAVGYSFSGGMSV